MLEKAEQGIWPTMAPLGYLNVDGPHGKKIIEPDPDIAPIVMRLFEWYVTGNYSLEKVTNMAQSAGLVFRRSQKPVPKATVHHILRNRIYTGDFDWQGKRYRGSHEPLITHDLWEKVQAILDHRFKTRHRKVKHDFAFSCLIACGHCGCSLVGEIKKGRYIYYHCTGYKGKCPDPYVREELLEERFAELLKGLRFDEDVLGWVTEALHQSHQYEKRFHDEAISRLMAEYTRFQHRIDGMYIDKLDGKIPVAYFEQKAAEWRAEQDRLQRSMEEHRTANQTYLHEGVRLTRTGPACARIVPKTRTSRETTALKFCTFELHLDGRRAAGHLSGNPLI